MSEGQRLRALVNERLTAAAEDIFALFERTIAEYEEELCRSKEENERKQQLLDAFVNSQERSYRDVQLQTVTLDDDVVSSLDQESIEAVQIKLEPEELSIKQEEEQPHEFTSVSERGEDDEQTDNDDDWELPAGSSAQRLETGEDKMDIKLSKKRRGPKNVGTRSKILKTSDRTVVHTGERPFSCSVCEKTFTQKATLRIHMSTHIEGLLFSCLQCDARFTQQHALTEHQKYHTGEKPFCCRSCGKAFKHIDNYNLHMAAHMGVKPFSCSECGAQFGKKQNAVRHMSVHTGLLPYKCSECDAGFVQKKQFTRHLKMHSAGQTQTSEEPQKSESM